MLSGLWRGDARDTLAGGTETTEGRGPTGEEQPNSLDGRGEGALDVLADGAETPGHSFCAGKMQLVARRMVGGRGVKCGGRGDERCVAGVERIRWKRETHHR